MNFDFKGDDDSEIDAFPPLSQAVQLYNAKMAYATETVKYKDSQILMRTEQEKLKDVISK